jgi:hypothetical protein
VDFYTDADIRVPKGEDEVKTKAIMLSHHVWDLLTYEKFNTLDLLESHTGVLKKKAMWYTKYFGGADNPPMPFHRKLYYIFGDKDTLKPVNVNLRKTIKELAEKKKWSGVTTIDKVMFDLENELRDPFVMSVFRIL